MKYSLRLLLESGAVALLFFLAFAFGLSPLYRTFGWDSATFLYMGKAIAQGGLVPYVELSDNKGILFLMIQALGQAISPDRWGTSFLFFGTLWTSVYGLYSIGLMRLSLSLTRVVVSVVLLFYSVSLADGNLTEDYALPVVLWVYYGLLHHTKWGSLPIRSFRFSFLLGASIAATALLRLNNSVLLLPWVFYPFLSMGINRYRWCLGLLLGVGVVCLPFLIGFDWQVLIQSWEDSVAYNFRYVESGGGDWNYWNALSLVVLAVSLFCLYHSQSIRERKPLFWVLLVAYITGFFVANMSKRYSHYQTLVIPLVLIGVMLMIEWLRSNRPKMVSILLFSRLVIGFSMVAMLLLFVRKVMFYRYVDELSSESTTELLHSVIPKEERNRVALFNVPIHYAYKADLYSTNPYCFSTVQMAALTDCVYEDRIGRSFLSEQTLWIVTSTKPDFTPSLFTLVGECFEVKNRTDEVIIWRRRSENRRELPLFLICE